MLRSFAGGSLFGQLTGSGHPRVLALHGWRRSLRDFDVVLGPSPDGSPPLDALALDLPGFGAAPPPPAGWGSGDYARAVQAVLAEMDGPLVVLGHSFGGRVAIHLAAAYPEEVAGLVLTGVPGLLPTPSRPPRPGYRVVRRLHRAGLVGDARMDRARTRYGSEDYREAEGVMREVFSELVREHYDEQLAAIHCPVTLVWGEEDTAAPVAGARRAAGLLSQAELVVEPGVGHLTPTEIPGVLRRAVDKRLAG